VLYHAFFIFVYIKYIYLLLVQASHGPAWHWYTI